ncbi:MAG: PQQ-dependent sugar dehydrogenase, partial [Phycisphaerales bacterium]|nr:PQQ-dependent sugar dehydrogenase [Phycisphaerales bacterium]
FAQPVYVAGPPGDVTRIFVAEQGGRVYAIVDGTRREDPFLDLSPRVTRSEGAGLLSLAFHPAFRTNGRLFVHYVTLDGRTRVSEFRADASGDRAELSSERVVLDVAQEETGHAGGQLAFGPEGYLYISIGDGGPRRDPHHKAQDLSLLDGSILRLDVDRAEPYEVPASNPFVNVTGARPEIWADGLRNPWRFSFDGGTGDLYVADVGEDEREEVTFLPTGNSGGANLGWNRLEGSECFDPSDGCDPAGTTLPALEYETTGFGGDCAIVGGFVYRGCATPGHRGRYFYGDFCSAFIRSFRLRDAAVVQERDWTEAFREANLESVVSFGQDARGELYVVDYRAGRLYRIEPRADSAS